MYAPWEMVVGLETELGIRPVDSRPINQIAAASELVDSYVKSIDVYKSWCYAGEDPLHDMFGGRLGRDEADPSQLTDVPLSPCARTNSSGVGETLVTNVVLPDGGRFYVDHAHPEVSTPECLGAVSAVLLDTRVKEIAQAAMMAAGNKFVLYRSNVDGKGATWGHHENYRICRKTNFADLASILIGHLITRPIFCGAGRVGIGSSGQVPGFQMSQRADYLETVSGLQTTFERPIINTRDEPHDDSEKWRRLHIIVGDSNSLLFSQYLRVSTTALVLWACERLLSRNPLLQTLGLIVADPVYESLKISHDTSLKHSITLASGAGASALELSLRYWELVRQEWDTFQGEKDFSATAEQRREVEDTLYHWKRVLEDLGTNPYLAKDRVEWVAKKSLLERYRERLSCGWNDPRIKALDLSWADMRQEYGPALKMEQSGAFTVPPLPVKPILSGRAHLRAKLAVNKHVVDLGWSFVTVSLGNQLRRFTLGSASDTYNSRVPVAELEGEELISFLEGLSENG
ncbi:proteasome accessory factor PafA2 family protein [Actinomycetaceae bacterium TAE3-ERU4]|nr:proteasome accessory factor PafA2 family protein [Actinomycetaceae bacterium TAE3-ERU4]